MGKAINQSSNSLGSFFSNLGKIKSLLSENNQLVEENNQLKAQVAQMAEIKHENEILKRELGFVQSQSGYELIPAKVVFHSPSSFLQYIKIDKGTKDGVKTGQAVLSNGHLLGVVKEVSNDFAEVNLVTNANSLIPVVLQNSRGTGLLAGGLKGLMAEDIPLDIKIEKNENVVTSGLGGDLPSGIIIGTVQETISGESEIFQRISVKSPIEFGKLEFVFVVK